MHAKFTGQWLVTKLLLSSVSELTLQPKTQVGILLHHIVAIWWIYPPQFLLVFFQLSFVSMEGAYRPSITRQHQPSRETPDIFDPSNRAMRSHMISLNHWHHLVTIFRLILFGPTHRPMYTQLAPEKPPTYNLLITAIMRIYSWYIQLLSIDHKQLYKVSGLWFGMPVLFPFYKLQQHAKYFFPDFSF